MIYISNHHVRYACKYHGVFCSKFRRKVLVGGVDKRLKEIIDPVAKELGCEILEREVMPGHIHILCEVDPQHGIHKFVKRAKGVRSRLLPQEFPQLKSRLPTLWTHSSFVSTFGGAPITDLKQSIENQKNA
jgi:putative transposase